MLIPVLSNPRCWRSLRSSCRNLPSLRALIFEIVPDFIGRHRPERHCDLPRSTQRHLGCSAAPFERQPSFAGTPDTMTPALWESTIGAAITGCESPDLPPDFVDWAQSAERP